MLKFLQSFFGFLGGLTNLFNRAKDRKAGRDEVKVAIYEKNKVVRDLANSIKSKRKRDRLHSNKRIK